MKLFTKITALLLLNVLITGCVKNPSSVYIQGSALRESRCQAGPKSIYFGYAKGIDITLAELKRRNSVLLLVTSGGGLAHSFRIDNRFRLTLKDRNDKVSHIYLSAQWGSISLDDLNTDKYVEFLGVNIEPPAHYKERVPYLLSWSQVQQIANAKSVDFVLESKSGDVQGNMDDSLPLFQNFVNGCRGR